ncbi:zf-DHHC-domain-containing protein [Delitschia confertaspora ATCC 74209]|uniref:Palmitoyltransferase PFA4 n=1 Tax=Delitschia confertaspora ATCC 74209 TaxID=1513339 RepID=A0A9P4JNH4_9PLEO|nr:zf-DHHC-domain-containing protein [Delitschia confertaspora ATCC 74209]
MEWSKLAVPSVCVLISFLAYSSQFLFLYLEPHPLERKQVIRFNVLLICLWISYARAVLTDPGTIPVKKGDGKANEEDERAGVKTRRWCRKCEAVKPPRAHHCKVCKRCIPKMDHHCPWTSNCISSTTFPSFLRFLFYAVVSMTYLSSFLYPRLYLLWTNRDLPISLGPPVWALIHLFLLCGALFFTLFALSILLIRNIWCLTVNITTIESWEIERHKALLRRSRYFGGYLDAPDGSRVRIQKQEFPYDIGIWENCKQGMGTGNILLWFFPLAPTPPISSGLTFPTNGFEDPSLSWPPPDPDRMYRKLPTPPDLAQSSSNGAHHLDANLSPSETLSAFRKRQEEDLIRRRRPFVQRLEARVQDQEEHAELDSFQEGWASGDDGEGVAADEDGEEAWRNSEGERLRDFGVDEEVEFYDEEEDVPLSELLARRRGIVVGS